MVFTLRIIILFHLHCLTTSIVIVRFFYGNVFSLVYVDREQNSNSIASSSVLLLSLFAPSPTWLFFACINRNETCHSHRPKKSSYLLFTPFTFADMLVVGSFNIEGFFIFIPLYRTNIDLFSTFYFFRHLTRAIGYAKKHACIEWDWDIFPSEYVCDGKKIILFGFKLTWPALNARFFHPIFMWHSEPFFD